MHARNEFAAVLTAALTFALVFALAPTALAHGGDYRQPAKGAGGFKGGPESGEVSASVTRWESWWASNKEYYLRFSKSFRRSQRAETPDGDGTRPVSRTEQTSEDFERSIQRHRLLPLFLEAMTDSEEEVRASAAIALGKTADARAVEPLREAAAEDPSIMVKESAVLGIGLLGREDQLPYLDTVLNSDAPARRRAFAAFGIGLTGGEQAAGSLMRCLVNGLGPARELGQKKLPREVTASIFVALGLSGGEEVPEFLRQSLASTRYDKDVRPFIILSLGRVKDVASRGTLVKMLVSEDDAGLRRSAAIALGKIAKGDDVLVVEALLAAIDRDRDPLTRHFAAIALGELDGIEVRDELRRLLEKGDSKVRPFAALALGRLRDHGSAPALRALLKKENSGSVRGAMCLALGLIGDKESIPLIEKQLGLPGGHVKGYAALALGMMASKDSSDEIYRNLEETTEPVLAVNYAIALGMLEDARVVSYLRDRTRGRLSNMLAPSAMVIGILRIGDLERQLVATVRSDSMDTAFRAHAVVALGMMADPSPIPKLSGLSIGNDYSRKLDPLREVLSIL